MVLSKRLLTVAILGAVVAGCQAPSSDSATDQVAAPTRIEPINPENWPLQAPVMVRDAAMEQQIADLLGRMTLEEKVGQVIQADIASVTPDEVREYNLGSILNGGGSAPGGDNRTTPDQWLALADEFWDASTDTSDGGVGIPALWGTDAVHGHSNILGATIFPHNIGLGMGNDPDMMYDIGRVTAMEMLVTGLDWTFAPTIAVVRNDRWGRTYESYSEDPAIVAAYAPKIIEGIQGRLGEPEFLDKGRMLATAKHFAGDGGTVDGKDQGETNISEAEFRDIQAAAYPPAVAAGIQSVMASFNSFHGRKMHGYKELLDDVLVGRMGFDGFVVGDWNGHGQIAGCTNTSCAASINAGLDMFMAPDSWKGLYENTLEQARSGEITGARLDEAVSRILRAKFRAGLFAAGAPSARPFAGEYERLAAPEHRAIARDAVRKSLVLLKNNGGLLPLNPGMNILLAGDGAHNIGKQSGGWTLNWQGTGNLREHFPNGTSILEGFEAAVTDAGGTVTLSENGDYTDAPDVAVVVFGEDPYAEFQGDRPTVDYDSDDGLNLLRGFRDAGIPTVAVFLSGRAMWVNPELNQADAFVAAWLPGTEGGGIADVLVAGAEGAPRFDFQGRLSFSWPRNAAQVEVNVGDENYNPQFAYGYGLGYGEPAEVGDLSEDSGLSGASADSGGVFLAYGDGVAPWSLVLRDADGDTRINDSRGSSPGRQIAVLPGDWEVQEDSSDFELSGPAELRIEGPPADFQRENNGDMTLELTLRVNALGSEPVTLGFGGASLDLTASMESIQGAGWQTRRVKLSCFEDEGADMTAVDEALALRGSEGLSLSIATVKIAANPGDASCQF